MEAELAAIDLACSRFRADSEITAVNQAAGAWFEAGELLWEALQAGLRAARLTDGLVDPTVGAAIRAVGYDRDFAEVATESGRLVIRVAPVPGWRVIQLDPTRRRVMTPPGVEIDLGATAKALAVDRCAAAAEATAGCGVLVSVGGDMAVAGEPPDHQWRVFVTDRHDAPEDAEGQSIQLVTGGLATSSTTRRRWRRGEIELHHIIDPRTGLPAREVWRTATVAAGDCVDANTASTAAIILGEEAPAWLEARGLPARLVRRDGRTVTVAGWPEPPSETSTESSTQTPA